MVHPVSSQIGNGTSNPHQSERFISRWLYMEKFFSKRILISRGNESQTSTNTTELNPSQTYPTMLTMRYTCTWVWVGTGDQVASGHMAGTANTSISYLVNSLECLICQNWSHSIVTPHINQPDTSKPWRRLRHSPLMTKSQNRDKAQPFGEVVNHYFIRGNIAVN